MSWSRRRASSFDFRMERGHCRSETATASERYRTSADLLGERDEDARRATDITEPIAVLVPHQLANQFGAVGAEPGNDIIDIFDGKHDATYAQRVRRGVGRLGAVSRRPP